MRERPGTVRAGTARARVMGRIAVVSAGIVAASIGGQTPAAELPCGYVTTEILGPTHLSLGQSTLRLEDLNDAGIAVGRYFWLSTAATPCTWDASNGVQAIPIGAPGIVSASADAINNNGWILVNTQTTRGRRGFVLIPNDDGGWDWVEMIPIAESPSESFVNGINDKNRVVGTQSAGRSGNIPHAGFLWSQETGRVDIAIGGWSSTGCIAINDAGTIAGDVSQSFVPSGSPSSRAFVLHQGEVTIVEPPKPYVRSWTAAVNELGVVAGAFNDSNGSQTIGVGFTIEAGDDSAQWTPAPFDASMWWPRDINDSGVMGGALYFGSTNATRACVTNGTEFINLTSYAPPSASHLREARAIRDDGVIVASCNSKCAVVLTPIVAIPGDADCDGSVGAGDLAVVIGLWGTSDGVADLNDDGVVDGADLGLVLGSWSQP